MRQRAGGRRKGDPMYPGKSVQGSHYLTKAADRKIRHASRRTGKSDSDVLEHCVHRTADSLTRAEADAIAEANRRG